MSSAAQSPGRCPTRNEGRPRAPIRPLRPGEAAIRHCPAYVHDDTDPVGLPAPKAALLWSGADGPVPRGPIRSASGGFLAGEAPQVVVGEHPAFGPPLLDLAHPTPIDAGGLGFQIRVDLRRW